MSEITHEGEAIEAVARAVFDGRLRWPRRPPNLLRR